MANHVNNCVGHLCDEVPVQLVQDEHVPYPPNYLEVEAFREQCHNPLEQVQLWLHLSLAKQEVKFLVVKAKDVLKTFLELRHFVCVEGIVADQCGRGYQSTEHRKGPELHPSYS